MRKHTITAITLTMVVMGLGISEPTIAEAATYKLKNGVLLNNTTGKAASGYVLYKGRLYKNGKLNKGYVVFHGKLYRNSVLNTGYEIIGKGQNMKLYYNATLKKGNKTARNKTLLFKNGVLAKGYVQTRDKERLYHNGYLAKGTTMYPQRDVATSKKLYLYHNGYLAKGLKRYRYLDKYTYLFDNGKLDTHKYRVHDNVLFHEGRKYLPPTLYNGNYYNRGIRTTGYYKDLFYIKGVLANGTYHDSEYKDGKLQFTVTKVEVVDRTTIIVYGTGLSGLRKEDLTVNNEPIKDRFYPEKNQMRVQLKTPLSSNKTATLKINDQMFDIAYVTKLEDIALWEDTFAENEAAMLAFDVDGKMATAEGLKAEGINVTFRADTPIFEEGTTSATGKLRAGTGQHPVKVTIETAEETKEKMMRVTFAELIAAEKESPYTLAVRKERTDVDEGNGYKRIQSNTLVIGERAYVQSAVFGKGSGRINGFGLILTSSNPDVVAVEQHPITEGRLPTDQLVAKKAGATTITVATTNGYSQQFDVTVRNEKRQLTTVKAPETYEAIANNTRTEKIAVALLDQYGDNLELAQPVRVVYPEILGMPAEGKLYSSYSPLQFNVKEAGKSGTILYKDSGGKILAKTVVNTIGLATKERLAVDRDVAQRQDMNMSLQVPLIYEDNEGNYAGAASVEDLKGYHVFFNPAMVTINEDTDGDYTFTGEERMPALNLRANHEGNTTITIYDPTMKKVLSKTWQFYDFQPSITSLKTKDLTTLTAPTTLSFRDVLYTKKEAGKDDIVEQVTLSRDHDYAVRSSMEKRSWSGYAEEADTPFVNYGDLYVDYDNDGHFSPSDARLTSLKTTDEKKYATTGRAVLKKEPITVEYENVIKKVIDVQ